MAKVLLISPCQIRPVEPPIGIFRAAAALNSSGVSARAVDAGILFLDHVLKSSATPGKPHLRDYTLSMTPETAFSALRDWKTYSLRNGASRLDLPLHSLDRLISLYAREYSDGAVLSLADASHNTLSRMNSHDLIRAAREPELLPYEDFHEAVLAPLIRSEKPEVIGISLTFLSQSLAAFAMMGWIRSRFPETRVVLGGALAACWTREKLGFAVREGICHKVYDDHAEVTFARDLGASGPGIPGLGSWVLPDYSGILDLGYLAPAPTLPLCLSHGCYWSKCLFCPEAGKGYNCMKASEAVRQMVRLGEAFGPSRQGLIHLTDNAVSPAHLRAIMDSRELSEANLSWWGFSRFEKILEEPGAAEKLAASGCVMLELGLETASQPLLDSMNKGTNAAQCSRIIRNLGEAGIKCFIYIMLGYPSETAHDRRQTAEFLMEHQANMAGINISMMSLPREGALAQGQDVPARKHISKVMPFKSNDDLTLYLDFEGLGSGGRPEMRRAMDQFRKIQAVREINARTPKFTKCYHSAYLCVANRL